MKKMLSGFILAFTLIACQKDPATSTTAGAQAWHLSPRNETDKLPGGGTNPSTGGQYSGVSNVTGYEQLAKHLVGGIWDGTYDFSWYNYSFNVSIVAYLANTYMGAPVGATFNSSSAFQNGASYPSPIINLGSGLYSFSMTYTLGSFTQAYFSDEYSTNGIEGWVTQVLNYFNSYNSNTTPIPPFPMAPPDSAVKISPSGGNQVVTVYGKFISIIPGPYDVPGIPYAIAELAWTTTNDNAFCNTQCQFCSTHPNDPSCSGPGGK